jgi:hypothetical protein
VVTAAGFAAIGVGRRETPVRNLWILAAGAACLSGGCNSTIDDGSGSTVTNASATGVWSGTDSVSNLGVTALINSGGQATFIRSDGLQFVGAVQVSGDTLAVTLDGYEDYPTLFADGSNYGIGTLNGTVSTGGTITATLTFTTNGGTALSGSWSLTFQTQSNNSSSTSAISGNYTDADSVSSGATVSITSSGVMTAQNPANSCVLNGSLSTADSSHDLYEVAYSYGNCTGSYAVLNGVQFTGLATLNSSGSITMAVAGASSSAKYAIVSTLNGS